MDNSEEIARRTQLALAAIKKSVDDENVVQFASHHLEELDMAYWEEHVGTGQPSVDEILGLLELRSHWGGEGDDGIEFFDFTLPGGITDYVLCVRFDDNGEVRDVSMES